MMCIRPKVLGTSRISATAIADVQGMRDGSRNGTAIATDSQDLAVIIFKHHSHMGITG